MTRKPLSILVLILIAAAAFYWFYESQEQVQETEEAFVEKSKGDKPPPALVFPNGQAPPLRSRGSAPTPGPSARDFPNSEEGRRLERHLEVMESMGVNAEENYQESLAELRAEPEKNIKILSGVYLTMPEGRYADRWKVVHTLAALQDDAGFAPLLAVAKQAIPPERFPGSHGPGSTGEERAIRVTAVEGLAELAKNGNAEAEAALLQLAVERDDLSTRRRAVRGYLAAGDDYEERVEELRAQIPPGDHSLITLEVTPPDEIPQPDFPSEQAIRSLHPRLNRPVRAFLGWIASGLIPPAWAIQCDYEPPTPEEFEAKGAEYVDFPALYEAHYSTDAWCSPKKIKKMWSDFGFENKIWNADTGLNDPCNLDFPLGRTFNALWLLYASAPDYVEKTDNIKLGILDWGYDFAAKVTSHIRLHCEGEGPSGAAAWYVPADGTMNLLWGGTLGTDIIARVGLIVHEAGHYWKLHVPAAGACRRNISCDPNWEYKGANTFEALWFWKFYLYAANTTSAHKDRAKVLGQDALDSGFNDPPGYTIY